MDNTKKSFFALLIILISIPSFAQKIKIDKQEIKLDDKTIGFIEGKKPFFKILSLDKSYAVIVELKKAPNEESLVLPWIELQDEKTGRYNELEFKSRKFSAFNYDRSVVYELFDRNYINAEGLNKTALENFINGELTGISAKRYGVQDQIENAENIADTYKIGIDDFGVIYSIKAQNPDPEDKRIGFIRMISPSSNGDLKYEVIDLDNNLIATWFARGGTFSRYEKLLNQELITFNGKVFKAAFENRGNPVGYKMSNDVTAMNIVRVLVGNGYTLGSHLRRN